MEKFIEEALLYDFYGELLTEHQKLIYEDFVLNDLSLSEIADHQRMIECINRIEMLSNTIVEEL